MTPVQGEPPKLDFKLPRRLKRWLSELRRFVTESQPINGEGITLSQTPKGRLLKAATADLPVTSTRTETYDMLSAGGTAQTDEWIDGRAYSAPGVLISHSPPYDSVMWKGPRLVSSADHTEVMTDSNGDTTDFNAYTLTLFYREVTFDATGKLRKIGQEGQHVLFTASNSVLTQ